MGVMTFAQPAVLVEGAGMGHQAITGVSALGKLGRVNPMEKFGFSLEATVWYTVSGVLQYYQDMDMQQDCLDASRRSSYENQLFVEWLACYPLHDVRYTSLQVTPVCVCVCACVCVCEREREHDCLNHLKPNSIRLPMIR